MKKENVGLYRHDSLGVLRNLLALEIERKRKETMKFFPY